MAPRRKTMTTVVKKTAEEISKTRSKSKTQANKKKPAMLASALPTSTAATYTIQAKRMTDQTRKRLQTFVNGMISEVRAGYYTKGSEFNIDERGIKAIWRQHDLITEKQIHLGDSLNPIINYAEIVSLGQVSVRKVAGVGGLMVTVNSYGAVS